MYARSTAGSTASTWPRTRSTRSASPPRRARRWRAAPNGHFSSPPWGEVGAQRRVGISPPRRAGRSARSAGGLFSSPPGGEGGAQRRVGRHALVERTGKKVFGSRLQAKSSSPPCGEVGAQRRVGRHALAERTGKKGVGPGLGGQNGRPADSREINFKPLTPNACWIQYEHVFW